jgi:quinolinate synthase
VRYVENALPNTTIIVGTEVNLVNRLAPENPDINVLDLHGSLCPNMFKINLKTLLWTLENIGKVNVIRVPEAIKADAQGNGSYVDFRASNNSIKAS